MIEIAFPDLENCALAMNLVDARVSGGVFSVSCFFIAGSCFIDEEVKTSEPDYSVWSRSNSFFRFPPNLLACCLALVFVVVGVVFLYIFSLLDNVALLIYS